MSGPLSAPERVALALRPDDALSSDGVTSRSAGAAVVGEGATRSLNGAASHLPDGFTVRLNRHTLVRDDGAVLVGGSPIRIARLSARARPLLRGREVTVSDAATRRLADHLLETGLGDPVLERMPRADLSHVTVVVPVHDRPTQLDRLLRGLRGSGGKRSGDGSDALAADRATLRIIVVDDASRDAIGIEAVAAAHGAEFVALTTNVGPAGARNAGLALVRTPFVAFADSDVVVDPATLELLARHLADPKLAMVAPRVLGLELDQPNWITRYEDARSSLDLGGETSMVKPRSPVTWVSSTCLVARADALRATTSDGIDGFDETMRVAEDVDLVWRLVDRGWRVRFEPAASVRHEHRTTMRAWLLRKAYYGTGAAPLAARHPDDIPPVVLPPWGAALVVALLAQRRWSPLAIAAVLVTTVARITRMARGTRHPLALALRLTAYGAVGATAQGFAMLLRHGWPIALVASIFSKRVRRAVLVAALGDVVWEWTRTRPQLDPVRFGLARRLDDIAFGGGMWWGALRSAARHPGALRALLPSVRPRG